MKELPGQKVTSPAEYAASVISLLNEAQRTIEIFSPELKPAVFSSIELVGAAREFLMRNQRCQMRILLRNTGPLTRSDHRFLDLVQRVSSRVSVRKLPSHFHDRDDAYVVADASRYVLRRQAESWNGIHEESRPERARQLITAFDEMWEHSLPDPGIRRLHI